MNVNKDLSYDETGLAKQPSFPARIIFNEGFNSHHEQKKKQQLSSA